MEVVHTLEPHMPEASRNRTRRVSCSTSSRRIPPPVPCGRAETLEMTRIRGTGYRRDRARRAAAAPPAPSGGSGRAPSPPNAPPGRRARTQANGPRTTQPALSADARFVAFQSCQNAHCRRFQRRPERHLHPPLRIRRERREVIMLHEQRQLRESTETGAVPGLFCSTNWGRSWSSPCKQ